jgi:uncharacterized membrane protein YgcG
MRKIAMVLSAAALLLAACSTREYKYTIPEGQRHPYSETVEVPYLSAADIYKKFRLYLVDRYWYTYGRSVATGNDRISFSINAGRLPGYSFRQSEDIIVYMEFGQYRVDYLAKDYLAAANKKELNNKISKRDADWQSFTSELEQALLAEPPTDDEYIQLMDNGYTEYESRRYENAKKYFYGALAYDPDNTAALIPYANCFTEIGNARVAGNALSGYFDMIKYLDVARYIYRLMPGDPIAESNIQICEQIQQNADQRRRAQLAQMEEERRRQQAEAWAATAQALGELSVALGETAAAFQGGQSGGGGSGSSGGGQGSTSSGGGTGASGGSAGSIASNPELARRTYANYERAVKDQITNAENEYRSSGRSDHLRTIERHLAEAQAKMKEYRLRANAQGVNIRESPYETAKPNYR